ncbi:hypothetical protein PIB30_026259 [Stylosanthes scabra]|uniref:Uncharacterized protein n=1 Tax=Stylosanthes scabra TaxID=79078 RepID=A0ABU6SAY8_9FABA|nr:hypothetical protein [Stylosanthes scabra]
MVEAMMVENGNVKEEFGECLIGHFDEGSTESHRLPLKSTSLSLNSKPFTANPPTSNASACPPLTPLILLREYSSLLTLDSSCILKVPAFRVYKSHSSCS